MKCFSIKSPVCVIPVYNYCLINIIDYLSAPSSILEKLNRADRISHASPHVAWVLVQCHVWLHTAVHF